MNKNYNTHAIILVCTLISSVAYVQTATAHTVEFVNGIKEKIDPERHLDDTMVSPLVEHITHACQVSVNGICVGENKTISVRIQNNTCTISFEYISPKNNANSKIRVVGGLKRSLNIARLLRTLGQKIGLLSVDGPSAVRVYFDYTIPANTTRICIGDIIFEKAALWTSRTPNLEIGFDGIRVIDC